MRYLFLIAPLLAVGCAAPTPLGIPPSEWQKLGPREKLEAYAAQDEIDREEPNARRGVTRTVAPPPAYQPVALSGNQARLACRLHTAHLRDALDWVAIAPAFVEVAEGEEVRISLAQEGGPTMFGGSVGYVRFDLEPAVRLCLQAGERDVYASDKCATFASSIVRLREGFSEDFEIERGLRGTFECQWVVTPRMPVLEMKERTSEPRVVESAPVQPTGANSDAGD